MCQCIIYHTSNHRHTWHRFEIYTLVSEIHENVDLVLGIKNVFELEGVINSSDCCFKYLNRSVPHIPRKGCNLKTK